MIEGVERVHYFENPQSSQEERDEIMGLLEQLKDKGPKVSYHFTHAVSEVIYHDEAPGQEEKKSCTFQGRNNVISGLKALLARPDKPQVQ